MHLKPMVKFSGGGGIPKILIFVQFFKILMVSDKVSHNALRIHKTL